MLIVNNCIWSRLLNRNWNIYFVFFRPLVGTALNTWGQIGFGIVLSLSAYFIYINYITNPEFYKSLKLSREAGKKDSHQQPAQ